MLAVPGTMNAGNRYLIVKAGDAESLIDAINLAAVMNADTLSERLFILIPNGLYDLGETVLTPIWGHNVALIGQSMEGTIIRNAPPVEKEGIGTTAVLLNRGVNTYVQDLTLQVFKRNFVKINNLDGTDSCGCKILDHGRSQCPRSGYNDPCCLYPLLALDSYLP